MILVDTTVWVDFFSARETKQVSCLVQYIEQKEELCICGIILTEILQGIRSQKEYAQVENLFNSLLYLEMDKDTFILAAEIYKSLRLRGITIRKTLDCMIASVAIKYKIPLLHNDRDYMPIEKYCGLETAKIY
jgi:predicted nucleic acid-binding protein